MVVRLEVSSIWISSVSQKISHLWNIIFEMYIFDL